jgi:hypothetical protein
MSACDMGALCCKSSPCAYLAVDGSAEEIAALVQKLNAENDILRAERDKLRTEVAEWQEVNEALRINANQPPSVAVQNARVLRADVERLRLADVRSSASIDILREEVARLRGALERIKELDCWHPNVSADGRPAQLAVGTFAAMADAALAKEAGDE